jgi:ketosteroid isomerase-like protein
MSTRTRLAFALLLAGCATVSSNDFQPGDAERAIAHANQQMVAGIRSGNARQVAAFYSDTATVMPPDAPAVTGRDAITQYWSGILRDGGLETTVVTDNVTQSCGDMAAERGHYEVKGHKGTYVVVWRKIDGQWKIWSDIFN